MPLLRSQQPPAPKPLWVRRVVEVPLDTGETIRVPAWCYGMLAVHRTFSKTTWGKDHPWIVTATTVGRATAAVGSEADARRMAERLWSLHADTYRLRDKDEMAAAIPESTKQWVRACREEGRYVDPESLPAV